MVGNSNDETNRQVLNLFKVHANNLSVNVKLSKHNYLK